MVSRYRTPCSLVAAQRMLFFVRNSAGNPSLEQLKLKMRLVFVLKINKMVCSSCLYYVNIIGKKIT